MKILFIDGCQQLLGGGGAVVIKQLEDLSKKHEIHFLNIYMDKRRYSFKTNNIIITSLYDKPKKGIYYTLIKPAMFFLTKKHEGYDAIITQDGGVTQFTGFRNNTIIYCHSPKRSIYDLYSYYSDKKKGIKKIIFKIYVHVFRLLTKLSMRGCKIILVNSKTVQKRVEKYWDRESRVCYPGPCNSPEKQKITYEPFFLYVGRIVDQKRPELAIKAAQISGKKLVLAGQIIDKSLTVNKPGNVEILGEVSKQKIAELYSKCIATIFTAKEEDFGLVPVESAYFKKPTIAVNEGGCKETVVNNKTGFLVNADPYEIAEKMKGLTQKKARQLGENAYKNAVKKFSWKKHLSKIEKTLWEFKLRNLALQQ